jgi:DNA-binding NarL/FixJ family response regulator
VEELLVAIHRLLDGEAYMSDTLEARLAAKFVDRRTLETDSPLDALSYRELQVFRQIGQGRSTRQIAETLNLSIKTVESHREHIKSKLSLESAHRRNKLHGTPDKGESVNRGFDHGKGNGAGDDRGGLFSRCAGGRMAWLG